MLRWKFEMALNNRFSLTMTPYQLFSLVSYCSKSCCSFPNFEQQWSVIMMFYTIFHTSACVKFIQERLICRLRRKWIVWQKKKQNVVLKFFFFFFFALIILFITVLTNVKTKKKKEKDYSFWRNASSIIKCAPNPERICAKNEVQISHWLLK